MKGLSEVGNRKSDYPSAWSWGLSLYHPVSLEKSHTHFFLSLPSSIHPKFHPTRLAASQRPQNSLANNEASTPHEESQHLPTPSPKALPSTVHSAASHCTPITDSANQQRVFIPHLGWCIRQLLQWSAGTCQVSASHAM